MVLAEEILPSETMLNPPPDLSFKPSNDLEESTEDSYCTVVFNDEVHGLFCCC